MSITLDKLRMLKRQAGDAAASSSQRTEPPPTQQLAADEACRAGDIATSPPAETHAASTHAIDADGVGNSSPSADSHQPSTTPHASLPPTPEALREPAGRAPPPRAATATSPPANASQARIARTPREASIEHLRRLLGVRERKPFLPPVARAPLDRSLPGEQIAPGLHYVEARVAHEIPAAALPLTFARRTDAVDPRSLLFFDTETTGLAGGTGTRAFMIGAADWCDGALRVRQLYMSTMAAEAAMLREFASWLHNDTVLASYNGRSYDAPLLKTRYRLARLPDPLHALDHVDLLHPTRRRYRGRWENCKLATIERELLRIVREDDLPGSQAPMAWLTFLRGGGSGLLRRVAAHNHQDVVTLAQLLLRLVEAQALDG